MSKKSDSNLHFDHILNSVPWREYRARHHWPSVEWNPEDLLPQIVATRSMPTAGDIKVIPAFAGAITPQNIAAYTKAAKTLEGTVLKVWFPQDYDPKMAQTLTENGWQECRHPISTTSTIKIDIDRKPEDILASLPKSTRYKIRKAEKEGVTVRMSNGTDADIAVLEEMSADMKKRTKSSARKLSSLREIWLEFKKADMLRVFIAEYKGEPQAAVGVIITDDTVWNRDSGAYRTYNKVNTPIYVRWKIMEHFATEGKRTTYNLLGVTPRKNREENIPHPIDGVTKFKQGLQEEIHDSLGVFELPLNESKFNWYKTIERYYLSAHNRITKGYWF